MMHTQSIGPIDPASDLPTVLALFREYVESLGIDLSFQNVDGELSSLPGKYATPHGVILLARGENGNALGCIAVRPLALANENNACEIKRLYVRPEGRGRALGQHLAQAAIAFARNRGYATVYLDTLDTMAPALKLYTALGFRPIPAYYDNPIPGTVYMSLSL